MSSGSSSRFLVDATSTRSSSTDRSGSPTRGRPPEDGSPRIPVELQLASVEARSVAVAGDFNGWDVVTMKKGEDGVFRVQLSLPRGRYQYAFLVDGQKWVPDPRADTTVDSGYGGADSVLDLTL